VDQDNQEPHRHMKSYLQ